MKKHFSILAIALMAVVVAFSSCKKDPKPEPTPVTPTPVYEKTIVDVTLTLSDDLYQFMNIGLNINDFEGNEQTVTLSDSTVLQYETEAKNASMKTIFTIAPKPDSELPVIDTSRYYTFSVDGLGNIAALDNKENVISNRNIGLINFVSPDFSIQVKGSKLTPEHIASIQETFGAFGVTRTFTVKDGETVVAE